MPVVKWGKRFENARGEEVKRADIAGGRGCQADFYRASVLFFDPALPFPSFAAAMALFLTPSGALLGLHLSRRRSGRAFTGL